MTAPALTPAPITCPRCRAALGVSAGDRLHVGPVTFDRRVVLRCGHCGGLRRWCPARPAAPGSHTSPETTSACRHTPAPSRE